MLAVTGLAGRVFWLTFQPGLLLQSQKEESQAMPRSMKSRMRPKVQEVNGLSEAEVRAALAAEKTQNQTNKENDR